MWYPVRRPGGRGQTYRHNIVSVEITGDAVTVVSTIEGHASGRTYRKVWAAGTQVDAYRTA